MRHSTFRLAVVLILVVSVSGCIPMGLLYTNVRTPVAAGSASNSKWSKVGYAQSRSFFGIIAVGDSSITEAMSNGGIKEIHHVDSKVTSMLLITHVDTIVYGN